MMKRNKFIWVAVMLVIGMMPVRAFADKVIYDAVTYPDLSEELGGEFAFFAALRGTGKTTITDKGNGKYLLKITIGNEELINMYLIKPSIINHQVVCFEYDSIPNSFWGFLIGPESFHLDIEGETLKFKVCTSDAFDKLFENLIAIKSGSSPGNSKSKGSSKSSSSSKPGLPTSGDLLPTTFVLHPFGFISYDVVNIPTILKQVRNAGWEVDYTEYKEGAQIAASPLRFTIPFTVYGKPVIWMYAHGDPDGKLRSYNLEIIDFKTNWSESEALELAQRIVKELEDAGYKKTNKNDLYGYQFYNQELVGDGVNYITVNASQNSIKESLDSFGVDIEVRR